MSARTISKLQTLFSSLTASALILSAGFSYADDTEIFFGGPAIDEGIRPNVLFILDNSGSMNWRLDSNNNASGSQKSRLQVLKSSFADILANTNDINVGVMVLNARSEYDNSRFVYPVEYIDKELPGDAELVATTPSIRQSSDDAVQPVSPLGSTTINDPVLVMGVIDATHPIPGQSNTALTTTGSFFRKTSNNAEYACRFSPPSRPNRPVCDNSLQTELNLRRSLNNVGLFHFQGLTIPAGANITNAYLEISPTNTPSNNSRRRPYLNVQVERKKTPEQLNDNNLVGSRTYTTARQTQVQGWQSGNRVIVELTSEVRTLQGSAPVADPIQGLFVRVSNTSSDNNNTQDYTFCVERCSQGQEPRLIIEYTADGLVPEKRLGGLRFQDVGIPQGAVVTSARLSFVPAAANSDPVTFQIKAEASDNASAFTNNGSLVNRSKTTATVRWEAPEWPHQSTPAPIPGPDVTNLVQEVVNRSGWCGNNAMAFYLDPLEGSGSRSAHSFDGAGGLQPTLTVSYIGGENGCFNSVIEARITANANDGYQDGSGYVNLGASTLPLTANQIAARFDNLPINPGATVMSAQLVVTPAQTVLNPSMGYYASFQNTALSDPFEATRYNFSNRTRRTSEFYCEINNTVGWNADQEVICDMPSPGSLSTIFSQSNWKRGGALNLFIRPQQNSNLLIKSFENNPGQSIKLRLKIQNGGFSRTVREQVNSLVQNMDAGDGTPIVPTFWDAVKYFRGSISGKTSPIESACQANHIVILTDGQASGNGAQSSIGGLIGTCSGDASDSDEQCARSLAKWINLNDQSTLEGENYITTHTVGFALDASGSSTSAAVKKFLREVAENGNGSFSTAENASELSDAFNRIIQEVLATDTSFVSASAPVNSFERSDNKDELYFSLFRPQETNRWPGNLKRYRYALVDANGNPKPHIVDVNNLPAVDPLTGQFADGAKSFWSTSADGNNTAAGGAASVLPNTRNVLTYIGNPPTSPASLVAINTSTAAITTALLGANDSAEREALIKYIRGLDPATDTPRKALGDPIHSSPRLATYSCETKVNGVCTSADQTAFIGTNEGYIHAFNTKTGAEQFAFMPQELLPNIKLLMENKRSSSLAPRRYGMDNPVVLWVNDVNKDGQILTSYGSNTAQTGEFIYAYATMGRGGRNVYAMDVTNRTSPKLLWVIKGGETPGFEKLGQTWSAPVKTRIRIGNATEPTDVLMFAGGYDEGQDNTKVRKEDTHGNAIYIVNAKTGALIWSASNTSGHTLVLPKMKYSMPGNLRVIDLSVNAQGKLEVDNEKLADQFFIGDMGGQVWRFFINNGKSGALVTPAGAGWTTTNSGGDGVFASVIPSNYDSMTEQEQQRHLRRFFNEPDAALLNKDGRLTLSVNIGSGHRGHPLEMITEDAFYSFRTAHLGGGGEGTIIPEDDMFDTSTTLFTSITSEQEQKTVKGQLNPTTDVGQNNENVSKGGWYIRLPANGEKVLTRSLTTGQDSIVFFNTYTPGSSTNANTCKAAFGQSRGYAVNLYDAMPYAKWVNGDPTLEDRWSDLKTSGIPPQPEQICIGDTCSVILSPDKIEEVEMPAQGKMYWIDDTQL